MICTCDVCRDDGPVTDEELREVVAEFMNAPRCSVKGKAAQAAVAALVLRELSFCGTCNNKVVISRYCQTCKQRT